MGDQQKQLDYFSIDFNEELSALFGGVLEQQTEFVAYAIQQILSLYKTEKTIILVGNSIGGLLCRKIEKKKDLDLIRCEFQVLFFYNLRVDSIQIPFV